MAGKLKPDVLILDVSMPELNGVEVTRQIKRLLPETEVLVFTGHESEKLVHELFAAGALGCVLKTEAGQHLIPAIKSLALHKPFFGSRATEVVFGTYRNGGLPSQTKRHAGSESPRARSGATALRRQEQQGSGRHPGRQRPDS